MTARNADGTEISAVERIGGEGGRGYPSQDPSSAFDGKEDPHRTGRFSGRGEHRLAVSPRRYRGEPVLQLVEGVSGSGQGRLAGDTAREAHQPGGEDAPRRGARSEGRACRKDAGEPSAQKA